MPVLVRIPEALASGLPSATVEAPSGSVRSVLAHVSRTQPALQGRLLNCEGDLRSVLRAVRDGKTVSIDEPLADGDTLSLEPNT